MWIKLTLTANVSIFSLWFVSSVSNSLFNRYQIRGFSIQSRLTHLLCRCRNFLFWLSMLFYIYGSVQVKSIWIALLSFGWQTFFFLSSKIESRKQRKLQISFGKTKWEMNEIEMPYNIAMRVGVCRTDRCKRETNICLNNENYAIIKWNCECEWLTENCITAKQ